ncbi:MAG: hypothetical protein H6Q78_1610, partial [Candidatus Krumholzibacteriota bacterium]|nr:hypothetical protein [Candidatus Krumholzibacteriota bacterium]
MKTRILSAIVLALALTACGDDDSPQAARKTIDVARAFPNLLFERPVDLQNA